MAPKVIQFWLGQSSEAKEGKNDVRVAHNPLSNMRLTSDILSVSLLYMPLV
jgi:cytosine/adenosine deaminase-related metal-dependent hydrolase